MDLYTGGCLCGDVRYEVSAEPVGAGQCYCRDCQYTAGGGPANGFVVPRSALRVVQGEPRAYESPTAAGNRARRFFCPRCGTPLFGDKTSAPDFVAVMAGTLDDPSRFRPTLVSWTDTAPPWAHLDPRLERFPRNAGDA